MKKTHSPIISFMDRFDLTASKLKFRDLGVASGSQHIVLSFKDLQESPVYLDYNNPVPLNKFCTLYKVINKRGTVYGYLFVVDITKVTLTGNRMQVRSSQNETMDFEPAPISDKNVLIYKSTSGCTLVIAVNQEDNEFLVRER